MMKFSVIIPVFNSEKTISATLDSCLRQTYDGEFEIIVINDGSDDRTQKIIDCYSDNRIRKFTIRNSGRANARNYGIDQAEGEYLLFLDSDDLLDEKVLSIAAQYLKEDSYDYCAYGAKYVKENSTLRLHNPSEFNNGDLLYKNVYPINSVVFRKSITKKFIPNLDYCEDWIFWLDTLLNKKSVIIKDFYGAIVKIHSSNTMSNYKKVMLGELLALNYAHVHCRRSLINRFKFLKDYVYLKVLYLDVDFKEININERIEFTGKKIVDSILKFEITNIVLKKYFSRNKSEILY